MNAQNPHRHRQGLRSGGGRQGFSLVEVVLSLGIVTFCSMTLIALIPAGLTANKLSREQIIALNLCRSIESDLKATSATGTTDPLYHITIPAAGATSSAILYDCYASSTSSFANPLYPPTGVTIPPAGSQYLFTITLTGPPLSSPNDPVNVKIQATWPPTATVPNVAGTVNLDVTINRFGS